MTTARRTGERAGNGGEGPARRSAGRGQKRVTIADVARASGASVSTVSRVINQVGTVAPDLADRVREAVADLGYRPNAAAQGLARGRSGTLGVLVPDLANQYFHDIIKALSTVARSSGSRVLVMDSNEDPAAERELAEDLVRYADGLLLCSPRMPRADLVALTGRDTPVLVTNRQEPGLGLRAITVDFFRGVLALCGHLAQLGHRDVVYVAGPGRAWAHHERVRALAAAEDFGLRVRTVEGGSTADDGYAAADAALGTGASAVMAYNDFVALGLLARFAELGVRVPGDVSLTGFDEIDMARFSAPPLTTVAIPRGRLGQAAGAALLRLMAGEDDIECESIPVDLHIRFSTGAPS